MAAAVYGTLIPEAGGENIPLLKKSIMIGRHPSSDIHLAFSNVSVKHCELVFSNGLWHAVDLGSTNGIRINDVRVVERQALLPGDRLTVARHFHFRIEYEASADARKAVETTSDDRNPFGKSLLEKAGLQWGSVKRNRQPGQA